MTDNQAPSIPPVEPAPWIQIQAGHELKHLVEVIRFAPGQPTGFLHSQFDAEQLLWKWFLKWREAAIEALPHPQGWQPDQQRVLHDIGVMAMTAQSDPFASAEAYRKALIDICNVALKAQET